MTKKEKIFVYFSTSPRLPSEGRAGGGTEQLPEVVCKLCGEHVRGRKYGARCVQTEERHWNNEGPLGEKTTQGKVAERQTSHQFCWKNAPTLFRIYHIFRWFRRPSLPHSPHSLNFFSILLTSLFLFLAFLICFPSNSFFQFPFHFFLFHEFQSFRLFLFAFPNFVFLYNI